MEIRNILTCGFNVLTKYKHGLFLCNKNDMYIGKAVDFYGEALEHEVDVIKQLCPFGCIACDVGANYGIFTIPLSRVASYVYAIEPQRIVYQTLCANMALNCIKNVQCKQYVISDTPGMDLIPNVDYEIEQNFGHFTVGGYSEGEAVARVALDGILKNADIGFIKIDVEGMEYEALKGSREIINRCRPIMYIENNGERHKELVELIKSMRYRLFWFMSPLFNPDNFFGIKENIYEGISSLNMVCIPEELDIKLHGFEEVTDIHPWVVKSD